MADALGLEPHLDSYAVLETVMADMLGRRVLTHHSQAEEAVEKDTTELLASNPGPQGD